MNKPIKEHVSAGGVLFNQTLDKICLVLKKQRHEYLLPHGHIKENEKLIDTAEREIKEETGYTNIKILEPINIIEINYELNSEPEFTHHKKIHYYSAKLISEDTKENTQEKDEGLVPTWFSLEEALKNIAYDGERATIKKAIEIIGL